MWIWTQAVVSLVGFFAQVSAAAPAAQVNQPWRDPSPHQVSFVTVDTSVRLDRPPPDAISGLLPQRGA